MKLYAMTCGQITGELGYLMEGGTGKVTLPIPAYLIVHPKGTALFDTGMHLHFDHVGGNALIPNATIIVQKREWQAGIDPEMARLRGFNRRDFDLGQPVRQVDGEYDVFGDGRVVCLPTHGHTPGHQSLRLRLDSGEVVLAGDACYFCQTLHERRLPTNVFDRDAMHASLERLAALEAGGARIFFGHDGEFWKSVPQAPVAII